jgi:enoyl-CoA hydratase
MPSANLTLPNFRNLIIQPDGQLWTLTINRPDTRNTLSIETLTELYQCFAQLPATLRVVILQGTAGAFAAGANINELLALTPKTASDFSQLGTKLFRLMNQLPQIIIAAIDGFCMGGGLDFALSCDLRYATPRATFAHPGAKIGIITGFSGTRRLPAAVGLSQAKRLFTTCESFSGEVAAQMGLVQACVSEVVTFSQQQAAKIIALPPPLVANLKTLARLSESPHAALLAEPFCQLANQQRTQQK